MRAEPTGLAALDIAITLVWLVGITNAFNLLDNMNGLSSGMAATTGTAMFALAILNGQRLVAALAAALVGGAVGFIPHNFPRARVFMGDGGSVTLGFLVAVVSLKLRFPVSPPWNFAAVVILLGVAILDTLVVVADRLRSGRPVMVGGTDHLSHRLVALGLSRHSAVLGLVGATAVFGALGLAVGRGGPPGVLVPLAALVFGAGFAAMLRVDVEPRQGRASQSPEILHLPSTSNGSGGSGPAAGSQIAVNATGQD